MSLETLEGHQPRLLPLHLWVTLPGTEQELEGPSQELEGDAVLPVLILGSHPSALQKQAQATG